MRWLALGHTAPELNASDMLYTLRAYLYRTL